MHMVITVTTAMIGQLNPGDRFTVTQFPEGTLTGEVEMHHGDNCTEVYIDGDDGLSTWPSTTTVAQVA